MNKARARRRARAWGRYFNHYAGNYGNAMGGRAAAALILRGIGRRGSTSRPFIYVRRQGRV